MSKHTLYYSKRCRFSQAFLEELASTPFVPEFNFVCVDPSPTRPALPGWLKTVPSLLVAREATPRVGPGPVNNWLFERKMGSSSSASSDPGKRSAANVLEERAALAAPVYSPDVAKPAASSRAPPSAPPSSMPSSTLPGAAGAIGGVGPEAYHGAEMAAGKWSDAYSFLGDPFTAERGFDPISRNFQSLVEGPVLTAAAGGGAAAAAAGATAKQTAKEAALLKEYEAYTRARDSDIGGPPKRI